MAKFLYLYKTQCNECNKNAQKKKLSKINYWQVIFKCIKIKLQSYVIFFPSKIYHGSLKTVFSIFLFHFLHRPLILVNHDKYNNPLYNLRENKKLSSPYILKQWFPN